MANIPKVIGQGTYGCVLKPSLKCKDKPDQSYDNKVSKILKIKDAKQEMNEYKKVSKVDKYNNFYLGKPDICDLDSTDKLANKSIENCYIGKDVLLKLTNYNLIVMEDGGENLLSYNRKVIKWSKTDNRSVLCEKFLLETLRLFHGLVQFDNHDLVHHDLKPENIVYNEDKNRLNFIDFGLMESRKKLMKAANNSKYKWDVFHWSYPWELQLLNHNTFTRIQPQNLFNKIKSGIATNNLDNTYYKHSNYFFYYVHNKHPYIPYSELCRKYVDDFELTLKTDISTMSYEKFLTKSMRTIDVFGVGIALKNWLNSAHSHLNPLYFTQLDLLFNNMISSRVSTRLLPEEALEAYENFLISSGLLEKYNKEIDDHTVVDIGSKRKVKLDKRPLNLNKKIKPPAGFGNADPKPCPEGKEINPHTGRCVKIRKTVKNTSNEPCPEGKERNPDTGRCVKIRKTVKNTSKEPCPEGKERNPDTGRCVNKCKNGYVRNTDFKCVKEKK